MECFCDICGKKLLEHQINRGFKKILCAKHYQQILKYGHTLDAIQRTAQDLNDFTIDRLSETVTINLYSRRSIKVAETKIDFGDLDRVIVKKWRFWKDRVFTGNTNPTSLHHFILGIETGELEKGVVVDHINSDPLDNRKSNLRVTTQQNNLCNKVIQSNNSTTFAGVWYDKTRKKYCAEIKMRGVKCFLGRHDTLEDAVYVRWVAENTLFCEFRSKANDENIAIQISNCQNKSKIEKYVLGRLQDRFPHNIKYRAIEGIEEYSALQFGSAVR